MEVFGTASRLRDFRCFLLGAVTWAVGGTPTAEEDQQLRLLLPDGPAQGISQFAGGSHADAFVARFQAETLTD
jgi:hypothetical protein